MLLSLVKVANPSSQDRTPRGAIVLAVSSAAAPYRASGLVHWRKADQPIALADGRFRGTSGLGPSTCDAARPSVAAAPFPPHGIGGHGPAPSRGHGVEAGAAPGHRYAYLSDPQTKLVADRVVPSGLTWPARRIILRQCWWQIISSSRF